MAHLTMVAPTELAGGFRLAGVDVVTADDAEQAGKALETLCRDPEVAVVGVYAPHFQALDAAARAVYNDSVAPVVIPVPLGVVGGGPDHRARLAALLHRAIGYRISFGAEEDS